MTISALTILILVVLAAIVVFALFLAYSTANRLDRLHVRTDLSWQALDAALARRAVVARTVAGEASVANTDQSRRLVALAGRAERANRAERESVENELSAALSRVDIETLRPQLVAELADAEARVLIARRFHNDSVRDTLALRMRRPVRLLHLGGTAPLPTYFEIAERAAPSADTGLSVDSTRTSARVVLLDERGRVLLLQGHDPVVPDVTFWFTVGGAVETGESLRAAAVRELREETGCIIEDSALRGPMWRRIAVFPFNGELIRSEELFFALELPSFEPHTGGRTELERQAITGHKWCTAEDLAALDALGETVYPRELADLLSEARQVVAAGAEPEVRSIR
ncbi:NUDIX hydrolase [Aldersonia kunmingensis]|uniref:NUDIX hydrolase n=1 Tax=Aldersonia kunmingensis TaxID=408066 RepID=UPI00082965A9|nr:NUDIX domain-containing protein [Aldersonia kunmingensis]